MINKGVTPVMCQKGSVGASGDLSPMGQMALVPLGEGEAFYQDQRMSGEEAMARAGIPTIKYEARDGLATINGSNVICGMGALQLYDAERWIKTSEIAGAMTIDALKCNMKAFDERLHKARGYPGAIICAENIRRIVEGSEILAQKDKRVQDAYSLRSTPQVMGAARDTLQFSRKMF
ncbi:aromatic amino acid lyase, partial [Candidatus Bathyarchaeota archaeon]|nr:aromatic amino acid lyase [Candidatus Bathyarchaeota archaeon]